MKFRIVTSIDQRLLDPTNSAFQEMVRQTGMDRVYEILSAIQRLPMTRNANPSDEIAIAVNRLLLGSTAENFQNFYANVVKRTNLMVFHIGICTDNSTIHCEIELRKNKDIIWKCWFHMPSIGANSRDLEMGGWPE
jgi:hypothetical protein